MTTRIATPRKQYEQNESKKKIVDGRTFDEQGQGVEQKKEKRKQRNLRQNSRHPFLFSGSWLLALVQIAQTLEVRLWC